MLSILKRAGEGVPKWRLGPEECFAQLWCRGTGTHVVRMGQIGRICWTETQNFRSLYGGFAHYRARHLLTLSSSPVYVGLFSKTQNATLIHRQAGRAPKEEK